MDTPDPILVMVKAANSSTHPEMDDAWWRERMHAALEALYEAGFVLRHEPE